CLFSMSILSSTFSGSLCSRARMTTISFLLSSPTLIMFLFGFGDLFVVEETESHETESLIIDFNVNSPWFAFCFIKWWDIQVLEDASKEDTVRKRGFPILYGVNHLMDNAVWQV
ncbi:hypothetical protein PanWU01x14_158790, partial [Parasponia andersonii]